MNEFIDLEETIPIESHFDSVNQRKLMIDQRNNRVLKCYAVNCKNICITKENEASFRRELEAFKKLGTHPNILKFMGQSKAELNREIFHVIVMEYLPRGTMGDVIFNPSYSYTDHTVIEWCRDILEALVHMHRMKIKHLDIKPANLFLTIDFRIKIGDFDLTRIDKSSAHCGEVAGTLRYKAPEAWSGTLSRKNDVWSFGIVLWEMIKRRYCFENLDVILPAIIKDRLQPRRIDSEHPICSLVLDSTIQDHVLRKSSREIRLDLHCMIKNRINDFDSRRFEPIEAGLTKLKSPLGFDICDEDDDFDGDPLSLFRNSKDSMSSSLSSVDDSDIDMIDEEKQLDAILGLMDRLQPMKGRYELQTGFLMAVTRASASAAKESLLERRNSVQPNVSRVTQDIRDQPYHRSGARSHQPSEKRSTDFNAMQIYLSTLAGILYHPPLDESSRTNSNI